MPAPLLALLLSLALLAPPGTSEDERLQAARKDYKEDRFGPAAWAFEALAKDYPENAKYHYFAGLARENAGHDTHAALHLRQFLASDAGTPEEREIAKKRVAAIAKRTTRVHVSLPSGESPKALQISYTGPKPPAAVPKLTILLNTLPREGTAYELTLEPGLWDLEAAPRQIGDVYIDTTHVEVQAGEPLKFVKLNSSPVIHELELTLGPPKAVRRGVKIHLRRTELPPEDHTFTARTDTTRQELLPGTYTYEATARGFRPAQGELRVRQPTFETITLTPKLDPQERRRRLKLGLSLAGAGLATGVAGTALLIIGQQHLDAIEPNAEGIDKYDARKPLALGEVGAGLLGATAGLWFGSLATPAVGKNAWHSELAIGALGAAAGAALYGLEISRWRREYSRGDYISNALLDRRPLLIMSGALLGLGVGLITSGTSGLISLNGRHRSPARVALHKHLRLGPPGAIVAVTF